MSYYIYTDNQGFRPATTQEMREGLLRQMREAEESALRRAKLEADCRELETRPLLRLIPLVQFGVLLPLMVYFAAELVELLLGLFL